MRSIDDIVIMTEDGLEVKDRKYAPGGRYDLKGLYSPDKDLIELFNFNIMDTYDYDVTLMHELMHAYDNNLSEEQVEFEAIQLVNHEYDMVEFAKDWFKVSYKGNRY